MGLGYLKMKKILVNVKMKNEKKRQKPNGLMRISNV